VARRARGNAWSQRETYLLGVFKKRGETMMGSVFVSCEDKTCVYNGAGRCIAERIEIVLDDDALVCDTYEDREGMYDDEYYNDMIGCIHDDWGCRD
jgi:hypothetical protein